MENGTNCTVIASTSTNNNNKNNITSANSLLNPYRDCKDNGTENIKKKKKKNASNKPNIIRIYLSAYFVPNLWLPLIASLQVLILLWLSFTTLHNNPARTFDKLKIRTVVTTNRNDSSNNAFILDISQSSQPIEQPKNQQPFESQQQQTQTPNSERIKPMNERLVVDLGLEHTDGLLNHTNETQTPQLAEIIERKNINEVYWNERSLYQAEHPQNYTWEPPTTTEANVRSVGNFTWAANKISTTITFNDNLNQNGTNNNTSIERNEQGNPPSPSSPLLLSSLRERRIVSTKAKNNLTAILHVGPHKTGSTTLQAWSGILMEHLLMDGYEAPWHSLQRRKSLEVQDDNHFIETMNTSSSFSPLDGDTSEQLGPGYNMFYLPFCFINKDSPFYKEKSPLCNPALIKEIERIANSRLNLFLSSESFVNVYVNVEEFIETVLAPHYQTIKVVFYYRRFYDWIQSSYNEKQKRLARQERLTADFYLRFYEISSLNNIFNKLYLSSNLLRFQSMQEQLKSNDKFDINVILQVYNIHELHGDNLLKSFFCDAIPNAKATCSRLHELLWEQDYINRFLQEHPGTILQPNCTNTTEVSISNDSDVLCLSLTLQEYETSKKYNSHVALIYEDLLYEAQARQYLSDDIVNNHPKVETSYFQRIVYMIQYHHEVTQNRSQYDFVASAILCPSPIAKEYLLQQSLEMEKQLFPLSNAVDWSGNMNNDSKNIDETTNLDNFIKNKFNQAASTSLCHIDASTAFDEKYDHDTNNVTLGNVRQLINDTSENTNSSYNSATTSPISTRDLSWTSFFTTLNKTLTSRCPSFRCVSNEWVGSLSDLILHAENAEAITRAEQAAAEMAAAEAEAKAKQAAAATVSGRSVTSFFINLFVNLQKAPNTATHWIQKKLTELRRELWGHRRPILVYLIVGTGLFVFFNRRRRNNRNSNQDRLIRNNNPVVKRL